MIHDLLCLALGGIKQESASDAAIILDRLQQFLFLLFAHAGKFANLAFAGQPGDAFEIAHLIGTPNERDGLGAQALDLEQVEHGGVVFLE